MSIKEEGGHCSRSWGMNLRIYLMWLNNMVLCTGNEGLRESKIHDDLDLLIQSICWFLVIFKEIKICEGKKKKGLYTVYTPLNFG